MTNQTKQKTISFANKYEMLAFTEGIKEGKSYYEKQLKEADELLFAFAFRTIKFSEHNKMPVEDRVCEYLAKKGYLEKVSERVYLVKGVSK